VYCTDSIYRWIDQVQLTIQNQSRNISRSGIHTYSVRCDGYTPVKTDISRLLSHQSTSKRPMCKHSRLLSPRDTTYTMTGRHPKF